MIFDYFKELILNNFGHNPTTQQQEVVEALTDFILSVDKGSSGQINDKVFILRGYAGTGKTSLISALVRTMEQLERRCVLMAPTGRAAKVLSLYSGHEAFTIHKRIYRQRSIDDDTIFSMGYNTMKNALFIVDEASMISNDATNAMYGTGRLLDDLIQFVYSGEGCRLILLGDTAQLPPVGETKSPALQPEVLMGYGLDVTCKTLSQVVRQCNLSGILKNATQLRGTISQSGQGAGFKVQWGKDVQNVPGNELIETLSNCYHNYGKDDTIVVCRSNKRAHVYNMGIRNQILDREEELASGDIIMIVKNNYYWTKNTKPPLTPPNGGELQPAVEKENEKRIRAQYQTADPTLYMLLKEYSQHHMKFPTEGETAMWHLLQGKQLGAKFRRQHIIADFIVDFVCIQHKLVIEVDGGYHLTPEQQKADSIRTKILNKLGYREIRFSNEAIIVNPDGVKNAIMSAIADCSNDILPHSGELEGASLSFIANGDIAQVLRVRNERELYGFRFADCELRFPDYDNMELTATVLLDTLHTEAPALPHEMSEQLWNRVLEDYADIPYKKDRMKKMKEDPYVNALQIKYAYAVTCHKAQGGQWSQVFIDQGYITPEMMGLDYYRWLYTAFTRATDNIYLVNWPEGNSV